MRSMFSFIIEDVEMLAIIFRAKRHLSRLLAMGLCLLANPVLRAESRGDEPAISVVGNEHVLKLGKKQQEAITTYDPEFEVRRLTDYIPTVVKEYPFSDQQTPFAVIGDFNGDGKKDVVLQGHDQANDLLIAILSSDHGPHVIEINKSKLTDPKTEYYGMGDHNENGLWRYLTLVPKTKVRSLYEDQPLKLSTDAFELQYFEKAAVLYYLRGENFQQYQTGD